MSPCTNRNRSSIASQALEHGTRQAASWLHHPHQAQPLIRNQTNVSNPENNAETSMQMPFVAHTSLFQRSSHPLVRPPSLEHAGINCHLHLLNHKPYRTLWHCGNPFPQVRLVTTPIPQTSKPRLPANGRPTPGFPQDERDFETIPKWEGNCMQGTVN